MNKFVTFCFVSSIATFLAVGNAEEIDTSPYAVSRIFHEAVGNKDDHRKLNHSKGFCAVGDFIPSPNALEFVDIPFLKEKAEARFRFSGVSGNLKISDKIATHGFAVKLSNSQGDWNLVMTNNPINFSSTKEDFVRFLSVQLPGRDPKEKEKYFATNPAAKRFLASASTLQPVDSVSHLYFSSAHTFFIKTSDGKIVPARIDIAPARGEKFLSKKELDKLGDSFLANNFQRDLKKGSIDYYVYFVLANKDDPIRDASMPWTGAHKKILAGTLKAKKYEGGVCNQEVYMPNILPDGINPPEDAIFELRNDVYAILFAERQ